MNKMINSATNTLRGTTVCVDSLRFMSVSSAPQAGFLSQPAGTESSTAARSRCRRMISSKSNASTALSPPVFRDRPLRDRHHRQAPSKGRPLSQPRVPALCLFLVRLLDPAFSAGSSVLSLCPLSSQRFLKRLRAQWSRATNTKPKLVLLLHSSNSASWCSFRFTSSGICSPDQAQCAKIARQAARTKSHSSIPVGTIFGD